jgi:predicted NBD/HSP70 family sugar kinase
VGGLAEALVVQDQYRRVLYVAPGTGIGVAFIMDGKIDSDLADNEAGHMAVAEENGQVKTWEDLASGRALKAKYGKLASEIVDPLQEKLKKLENKMVPIPPIIQAKRPEEAVIYGCYELIKQHQ